MSPRMSARGFARRRETRRAPTRQHNYLALVERMRADGMFPPGSLTELDITHDVWCDFHHDRFCNCEPTISIHPVVLPNADDVTSYGACHAK